MKIRNEVKVGILAIVAIFCLVWGYNFLNGKNILSDDIILNAKFKSVEGLNIAAPVRISGFQVGAVTNIQLVTETVKGRGGKDSIITVAVAELSVQNGTKIPPNVYAEIVSPSLLSGKEVALRFHGLCDSDCLSGRKNDIEGREAGMLAAIMETAQPILDTLEGKAMPILDGFSSLGGKNGPISDIGGIIQNLKLMTDQINNLLLSASSNLSSTMSHLNSITGNIKESNSEITSLIGNANEITGEIKEADLGGTLKEAKDMVGNLNETVGTVQKTLKKTHKALDNVTELTDFSNKKGLIASLLHDEDFDTEVKLTIKDLQLLMEDLRLHPERYRTVLSGKKKKYVPTQEGEDPADKNE